MAESSNISRRVILDKARAISTAKNPKDSHLGRALLRNNVFQGRLLGGELGKIKEESRRHQMHLDQQRKLFLRRHILPEPTILVERPPSPEMLRRALHPEYYEDDDSYYFDPAMPPHYMKPLKSRDSVPSTLVTMDVFRKHRKKKVNVWEEAMIERDKPVFQSMVKPASRLTDREKQHLQNCWSKLKQINTDDVRPSTSSLALVKSIPSRRAHSVPVRKAKSAGKIGLQHLFSASSEQATHFGAKSDFKLSTPSKEATFITELPEFRNKQENEANKEKYDKSDKNIQSTELDCSKSESEVHTHTTNRQHSPPKLVAFKEKGEDKNSKKGKGRKLSSKKQNKKSLLEIIVDEDAIN